MHTCTTFLSGPRTCLACACLGAGKKSQSIHCVCKKKSQCIYCCAYLGAGASPGCQHVRAVPNARSSCAEALAVSLSQPLKSCASSPADQVQCMIRVILKGEYPIKMGEINFYKNE